MFRQADRPRFYLDRDDNLVFVPKFWDQVSTMWGVYCYPDSLYSYSAEGKVGTLEDKIDSSLCWNGPYREVDVEITVTEK